MSLSLSKCQMQRSAEEIIRGAKRSATEAPVEVQYVGKAVPGAQGKGNDFLHYYRVGDS